MAIEEKFYEDHKEDSRGRVVSHGPVRLQDIQADNVLHCATAIREGDVSDEERVMIEYAARILFEIKSGEPDMQEITNHTDKINKAVAQHGLRRTIR